MGDLSPHFSAREFICKHCGEVGGVTDALVQVLETLRAMDGRPLRIVSGFRCPTHNTAVGGARSSRHLVGDAADIPGGRFTVAQARRAGASGIGHRRGWVEHVDTRPGGRVVTWRYR